MRNLYDEERRLKDSWMMMDRKAECIDWMREVYYDCIEKGIDTIQFDVLYQYLFYKEGFPSLDEFFGILRL